MSEVSEVSIVTKSTAAGVDLTGRRALVTGAASGIGRAIVQRLARAGAAVTVLDLNGDDAQKVADEIGGVAMQADFSDYGVLDSLEIEADIAVNDAGIQYIAPIEEFPPERFSLILRIMVEAPFRLVRAALPGMYQKGWGRVINVSSVHGLRASRLSGEMGMRSPQLQGVRHRRAAIRPPFEISEGIYE